ncbi:MAG: hypothetical protein MSP08_03220 [Clostridiales bacterium]|nr:hypothetical protein [Clostridiales bacterium]
MCITTSQSFSNLASIVVARSEADNFADACTEWDVTGLEVIDPHASEGEGPGRCVCGHYPILDCYAIRNRLNGSTLYPVGNVCIRHFGRADMADDADGLLAVARVREQSTRLAPGERLPIKPREARKGVRPLTRRAIDALYRIGALDPRDGDDLAGYSAETAHDVVHTAFNMRNPSDRLLAFAHAFVEKRARPFLEQHAEKLAFPAASLR